MQYSLNLGDIYAILTAICWSCGVICFDIAGRVLNSLQISLLKNIVGVLGFIGFLLLQGDPFPVFAQHDYFILVVSGLIGVALGDLLFLASLRRIGSGMSAIISTSYSVSIFILAYIMYQEVISVFAYFGGALVISGVIVGTMESPENRDPRDIYIGAFYGFLAHFFTAYSVLLLRPVMESHPVVPIALVRFTTGIIFSAAAIVYLNGYSELRETMAKGFGHVYLLAGSFLGTFLSVIFWLSGYKYTLAGRAAIYNQLSTIFIIILAAIFLKEVMTTKKWGAVSLALLGAFIVSIY
jgi:drug/metabolite transporter (DMT)-like permease